MAYLEATVLYGVAAHCDHIVYRPCYYLRVQLTHLDKLYGECNKTACAGTNSEYRCSFPKYGCISGHKLASSVVLTFCRLLQSFFFFFFFLAPGNKARSIGIIDPKCCTLFRMEGMHKIYSCG